MSDSVAEAKSERHARESDVKLHETVDTLKAHFSGVRGVVSELSQLSNPKYALAVSVAFGRHMDSIVVDEQDTAIQCIHYLREQRLAPLTFIPLSTIKTKPVADSLRALGQRGFPLAIDCISFDSEFEKAFLYALGDALICDSDKSEEANIQKAQQLCYGSRAQGAEKAKCQSP